MSFTLEREKEGSVPMLDMDIRNNEDNFGSQHSTTNALIQHMTGNDLNFTALARNITTQWS